jgi:hypothetical protein
VDSVLEPWSGVMCMIGAEGWRRSDRVRQYLVNGSITNAGSYVVGMGNFRRMSIVIPPMSWRRVYWGISSSICNARGGWGIEDLFPPAPPPSSPSPWRRRSHNGSTSTAGLRGRRRAGLGEPRSCALRCAARQRASVPQIRAELSLRKFFNGS